jgi:hypothetical protein
VKLVVQAELDGITLNELCCRAVAEYVGSLLCD